MIHCGAFFTALHYMQRDLSDGNEVCPSVRPSHACIVTKRTKVPPTFLYRTKGKFIYFSDTKMVGGGRHLLPEILGQTDAPSFKNEVKTTIFNRYSLVAAQPLDLAKKVQL